MIHRAEFDKPHCCKAGGFVAVKENLDFHAVVW